MNDAPKLLVEWSSPWDEFRTAIRPALGKSPQSLAGEAQVGLFPYRGILISWVLEIALLVAVIVLPAKLASMQPFEPPPKPKYDIIYYSGNELPRTEDVGGAEAGRSGRSGGREAHHPTQTIRVARGSTLRETVADAPKLDLPKSNSAVANLLALKALPGPAPAEGMRSSLACADFATNGGSAGSPSGPDQLQKVPQLNVGVVPPSAAAPQRELAQLHLPGSQVMEVVPPPVSAPEQMTESESAADPARTQRGCAAARHDAGDADYGPRLRCRRAAKADCSADGAGGRRFSATPCDQRAWHCFGGAAHGPVRRRLGAAFRRGRAGHRHGRGTASSVGFRRRFAHRPRQRKPRRGIWRASGRGPGRSSAQQQRRRKHLRSGGFQPARIASRRARKWRQRSFGHVSFGRRQARPGRIGRWLGNRTR